MSETAFQQLARQPAQHQPGCPILVEAGALLLHTPSQSLLAQLKLLTLNGKAPKAVIVRLELFDVTGESLGTCEHQYLDLNTPADASFGSQTPIRIGDNTARSYTVTVLTAIFQDGETWQNTDAQPHAALPEGEPLPFGGELLEQYRRSTQSAALRYAFLEHEGLWHCGCGAWNACAHLACHACSTSMARQKEFSDPATLQEALKVYTEEQTQLRNREEKVTEARRKRVRMIRNIIVTALIVLALFWFFAVPPLGNMLGDSFYAKGSYQTAYYAYTAAQNTQKAREAAQQAGDACMNAGDYAAAATAYGNAGNNAAKQNALYFDMARNATSVHTLPSGVRTYEDPQSSCIGFVHFGEDRWITPPVYTGYHTVNGLTGPDSEIILAIKGRKGYANEETYIIRAQDGSTKFLGKVVNFEDYLYEHEVCLIEVGIGLADYGFLDRQGNLLGGQLFDYAHTFSEGVAAVRDSNGKWGYIDTNGNPVTEMIYASAYDMRNGYAQVIKNDKWGLIDRTGKVVIQPTWGYVEASETFIAQGIAKVKTNALHADGGSFGLVRLSDGKTILQAKYSEMGDHFGEGLLYVHTASTAGFVNASGTMVLRLNLSSMGISEPYGCDGFKNGYAVLTAWVNNSNSRRGSRDLMHCVIDKQGKIVVPFTDDTISHYGDYIQVKEWVIGSGYKINKTYYIVNGKLTTVRPSN